MVRLLSTLTPGTAIPLAARIVALTDSYDAMTSDRPYRAALPRRMAIGEIEAGAGRQFDPAPAEQFLMLLRRYGEALSPGAPGTARAGRR
jgi:HD-GYP domain-containing protein (c-di-GMP phosphodiesterase class II)